jgi:hypothetical protein
MTLKSSKKIKTKTICEKSYFRMNVKSMYMLSIKLTFSISILGIEMMKKTI